MKPIRFGADGRRLFGLYLPPGGDAERNESVLLCNPFGQEAIRSHRLFRALGDRLAKSGFHVMRFDYFGTGDSDGDDESGDIDTWVADVALASDELMNLSGNCSVSWLGMRLGASLCALASGTAADAPAKLLLWEPVVQGAQYLQLLEKAHLEGMKADYGERWNNEDDLRALASGTITSEALGFPLSAGMRGKITSIDPQSFATCRVPLIHVFATAQDQDGALLAGACRSNGATVYEHAIKTEIRWATNEAMNSSIVPAEALQSITSALTGE